MTYNAVMTALWVGWAVAFAIIEGVALYHDYRDVPGGTLSAHLRRWFSVKTKLGRTAFLVVFGGFCAWFFPHILLGW